ncbi:5-oxoprolinase subunit B family protein [Allobranchiibius huperziae]|uniref:KipI family sensor histidine kinase inhibitor n=1 Tax=Allobranchiibius huperziae TaxID=1874116 RepID=A0A853DKZ6_9MICO|nr:allophanate hydrolase subunit 1 [Allobranchiibius huperziae]NYJ75674.1 KipI family sensor histidine kinase inhibitor [Allobranchiibius huperziae]
MRLLPCGESAILVELDSTEERDALHDWLRSSRPAAVASYVPAHLTVLVVVVTPAQVPSVADWLRALTLSDPPARPTGAPEELVVEVTYDGADLRDVADHLGITPDEVVRRHTQQRWHVEFVGFKPGFGYLIGDSGGLHVPRRESPRTRIPRGAVALAGDYSGVYPSPSPGGWQLIGHTGQVLFDPDATPAARLTAGTVVRFVEVPARG